MKTRGRILLSGMLAICMACCLSACNPKEKIDELLTPTSVEEAMANKAAEANPLLSSPDIIEDGYLTVGLRTTETTAPFCIVQSTGEVIGMDVDLASQVANILGLKVRFVSVTSIEAALGTQCDIVMSVEVGDAENVTVVGAYAENATALFRAGDATPVSADGLGGAAVGVQRGSISQRLLSQSNLNVSETSFDNLNDAFEALASGSVEYVCCDLYSGAYLASFYGDISPVGTLDVPTAVGVAAASGNTAVQIQVQSALDSIQTNGQGELVRVKWIAGMPNATNASLIEGLE